MKVSHSAANYTPRWLSACRRASWSGVQFHPIKDDSAARKRVSPHETNIFIFGDTDAGCFGMGGGFDLDAARRGWSAGNVERPLRSQSRNLVRAVAFALESATLPGGHIPAAHPSGRALGVALGP